MNAQALVIHQDFDTPQPSWQNGRVPMITSPQATPQSTHRDPTIADLNTLVRSAGLATPVVAYERLKGDASNRTYSRIRLTQGSRPATVVLMELAEPEAFKRSEEAVSGGDASISELPFINIQRYLQGRGVAVPTVHVYEAASGRLLLEDLGDCTLFDAVAGASPERTEALYRSAIDELLMLQTPGAVPERNRCVAFTRRFDQPLFLWELDHFLEYGIEARTGSAVPKAPREAIRRAFTRVAEELAAAPRVFVHRDYHSRNLMLIGERLRVIDFQDALTGPRTYDLASLLRDSYVTLDEGLIDRLIAYYSSSPNHSAVDPAAFRRLFDVNGFQRNLKAAGRFIYIEKVKGRPTHLPYVTPTLRSARRVLDKYPDFAELRGLLAPYVPEFM
jgi:aminoglycoside/choline kinase family phosphotransferase